MPSRARACIGIAVALGLAGAAGVAAARDSGGTGIVRVGAVASQGAAADRQAPVTAEERRQAGEVALGHTGGGTIDDIDMEAANSVFEVEVDTPDRGEVDVYVSRDFKVIGEEADDDFDEDDDCDDD